VLDDVSAAAFADLATADAGMQSGTAAANEATAANLRTDLVRDELMAVLSKAKVQRGSSDLRWKITLW
jgi:hypothetical protein